MKKLTAILLFLVTAAAAAGFAQSQRNFINVEGPDLKSRLAAAGRQGSAQKGRFWAAYTFAVKPGVAFDAIFIGSTGRSFVVNGATHIPGGGTPNLGVFLLHESGSVQRAEIHNLDRQRDYAGVPVYWLGRGAGSESLPLLRSLIDAARLYDSVPRLVEAIGAHDDPGVPATLREIFRATRNDRARRTAISWLGNWPGQTDFLSAVVRDERELSGIRSEAAEAIGDTPEPTALRTLQDLYRGVTHREVKQELLETMAADRFGSDALGFLVQTVQREPDQLLQRQAVEAIGEIGNNDAIAALKQLFAGANQRLLKEEILEAIAETADPPSAVALLMDVARNDSDRKLREHALETLGNLDDERAIDALVQSYDQARDEQTKDEILDALGDSESTQALQKLMAVAQRDPSLKLRRRAIALLGESEDPAAFTFLEELIK
jgi:HEAT repeat protein